MPRMPRFIRRIGTRWKLRNRTSVTSSDPAVAAKLESISRKQTWYGRFTRWGAKALSGNRVTRWIGSKLLIKPVAKILKKLGFGKLATRMLTFMAGRSLLAKILAGVAGTTVIAGLKKMFSGNKKPDDPNADGSLPKNVKDPAEDNSLDKSLNTEDNLEKFNRLSQERKTAEATRQMNELKIQVEKAKKHREDAANRKIDPNNPSELEQKLTEINKANGEVIDSIDKRLGIIDNRLQGQQATINQINDNVIKVNKSLSEKIKASYRSLKDKLSIKVQEKKGGFLAWIGNTLGTIWNFVKAIGGALALVLGALAVKGVGKLKEGYNWVKDKTKSLFSGSDNDSEADTKGADKVLDETAKNPEKVEKSVESTTDKENPTNVKTEETPKKEEKENDSNNSDSEEETSDNEENTPADKINTAMDVAETGMFVGWGAKTLSKGKHVINSLRSKVSPNKVANKSEGFFSKAWNKVKSVGKKISNAGARVWNAGKKFVATHAQKLFNKVMNSKFAKFITGKVFKKIAKVVGGRALKTVLKRVPVVGLLAGLGYGIARAVSGDWAGAGLELASGAASLIDLVPGLQGVGTAVGLGIDAASLARDLKRESEEEPEHNPTGSIKLASDGSGIEVDDKFIDPTVRSSIKTQPDRLKEVTSTRMTTISNAGSNYNIRPVAPNSSIPSVQRNKVSLTPVNQRKPISNEDLNKKMDQMMDLTGALAIQGVANANLQNTKVFTINGQYGDLTGTSM